MEVLDFSKREKIGKASRSLKKEGIVPCVIYNAKGDSSSVQMSYKVAEALLKTATTTSIFDANIDGKKMKVVLKDVDRNPTKGTVGHLSFFQIDEGQPMLFSIPFNIIGISPAVKNNIGLLIKALSSLEVKCKLADLVPQIDIDISVLEHPGQTISVSDIALPAGMTLPNEEQANSAIVTITQLQKVEEAAPVVEATPEEGAEVAEGTTPEETPAK